MTGAAVRFPDGRDVPIEWAYPDAPQYEWLLEREHWPEPLTPVERWIWHHGAAGGDRAWAEAGLEPPPAFYRFQTCGPFLYVNVAEPPPERLMALAPRYTAVAQEYGGALRFWATFCEPRIKQACADLAAMDDRADLGAAAETLFYGFHQTFTCLGLLFLPSLRLSAMLKEYDVAEPDLTALELTQGGENATQRIDEEIWRLAELARATPAVARLLQSDNDALAALRGEPAARAFVEAFDALIERHGSRSQGWMLSVATWRERPEAALALVSAQVTAERISPDELRARTAERREAATERVLAALPPERHDEFRSVLAELDGYVPIREDRAYWQLVIAGETRALTLRIGERLVREGRLARAEDVCFLTPEDFDAPGDLRPLTAQRRAAWEGWRAVEPPLVIGTPGTAAADAQEKREHFRGAAASRGVVTAPVRIVHSPEDGARLERGDILVCTMTTPAWTPLFAIAGGVITETGGALSHPAITAREYGIPAVVALADATTKLKDGQVVTIDGAAGTVTAAGGS
jgi:pyruvate,water dikinase